MSPYPCGLPDVVAAIQAGEIEMPMDEAEALARDMCEGDPDELEEVQLAGARYSLSGLISSASYDKRPRWKSYLEDARKAIAARDHFDRERES